jgi:hypothetical protein
VSFSANSLSGTMPSLIPYLLVLLEVRLHVR